MKEREKIEERTRAKKRERERERHTESEVDDLLLSLSYIIATSIIIISARINLCVCARSNRHLSAMRNEPL